jgi:hypothetical protein
MKKSINLLENIILQKYEDMKKSIGLLKNFVLSRKSET